ncbi:hypothetical protein ACIP9H_40370 [Streptomyces sp. NPDC088732]|uniref:hypothetical protein n=1 Tax=Streptomyces sp. NPDC088732 TaxID=3365879 RepID=UPI0038254264
MDRTDLLSSQPSPTPRADEHRDDTGTIVLPRPGRTVAAVGLIRGGVLVARTAEGTAGLRITPRALHDARRSLATAEQCLARPGVNSLRRWRLGLTVDSARAALRAGTTA